MAWFRCSIRGENFPGELIGEHGLIGFLISRDVEAGSAEQAEDYALELLRAEPKLTPPAGYIPTGIARIFVEEIVEVSAAESPSQQQGFTFYSMNTES